MGNDLYYNTIKNFNADIIYDNCYVRGNITKYTLTGNRFTGISQNMDLLMTPLEEVNIIYEYDDNNRIIKEAKSTGDTLYYSYGITSGMVEKVAKNNQDNVIKEFIYDLDKLIKINNIDVNYDNYGNIIRIGDIQFTYDLRNQLESYIKNDIISFEYNYQGIRTKKRSNNYEVNYYLDENRIIGEDVVDLITNKIIRKFRYLYDSDGICGINYIIDDIDHYYNFIKDPLGNISEIMHEEKIIGEYTYDAWGNCQIKIFEDISPNEIDKYVINNNPFRYKEYYYDIETNLYYCERRYYNPEIYQWISPDGIGYLDFKSINGLNLYCYCNNNPVMNKDPNGCFAITLSFLLLSGLAAGAIGAVIGAGTAFFKDIKDDGTINEDWTYYLGRVLGGFVSGFGIGVCTVLGAGVGAAAYGGTVATLFTSSGLALSLGTAVGIGSGVAFTTGIAGYAIRTGISKSENFNMQNMFSEGLFNAASGVLSVFGGYLGGLAGFYDSKFINQPFRKEDFIFSLFVGNAYTVGFKVLIAFIKSYILGDDE